MCFKASVSWRQLTGPSENFTSFGLPAAPRGMPQVEVTFDIDANGILHVSAKDLATGKEQNITITASTGMSEADIQKMVKDAELHMEEDKKKKEEVDLRNQLDNLIYGTEKTLNDSRDKISAEEAKSVEDALNSAKDAVKSGDVNRMRPAMDQVTKASHKLAEVLYKQTASQRPGGQAGEAGPQHEARSQQGGRGNDDVVDVEFEDVKK